MRAHQATLGNFLKIRVNAHLSYAVSEPCDILLQIEAAPGNDQEIVFDELILPPELAIRRVAGEDGIGERIWLQPKKEFECVYEATISVSRLPVALTGLQQTPLSELPSDAVKYLMSSRFCHPEHFHAFTTGEFGDLTGGALVSAMRDWIFENIQYVSGASDAQTTAHDTFASRQGVCRDCAHVLIAMARAVAIPARMVSAYAPDVDPQDFHAVVEVYLHGAWHLVDPTDMAKAEDIVRIGVGRDAADVAFLTAYGLLELREQSVEVAR